MKESTSSTTCDKEATDSSVLDREELRHLAKLLDRRRCKLGDHDPWSFTSGEYQYYTFGDVLDYERESWTNDNGERRCGQHKWSTHPDLELIVESCEAFGISLQEAPEIAGEHYTRVPAPDGYEIERITDPLVEAVRSSSSGEEDGEVTGGDGADVDADTSDNGSEIKNRGGGENRAPAPSSTPTSAALTNVLSCEHPAYPLARVWEMPERIRASTYKTPIAEARTYLCLAWTINELADVDGTRIPTSPIYSRIPDTAEDELRQYSERGLSGVENVLVDGTTISRSIDYYRDDETGDITGRSAAEWSTSQSVARAFDAMDGGVLDAADAIENLIEHGDLSALDALFNHAAITSASTAASQAATPPDAAADGDAAGPRPNEHSICLGGDYFATAPLSRLSSYTGTFEPEIIAVDGNTLRGISDTLRGISGPQTRDRRTLEDVPLEVQEELLRREPLDRVPDKPVPTDTYEDLIEWRPILEWSASMMSISQLILTSTKRDDNAATERTCAGMPICEGILAAAVGYTPQALRDRGLNTGIVLELHQSRVDSDLIWSGWNHKQNRARVVLNHSIPHSIMHNYLEFTMSPAEETDRTFLISGDAANSRDALRPERDKRERIVNSYEPRIDPPDTTLMMKDYLNNLSKRPVFTAQYGLFGGGGFETMIETAKEVPDEQRRRQELRNLYYMQAFPKPLYVECDWSPRLRAEKMNQFMNVKTEIRKSVYQESKHRELDLSKAHLACYIPTVREHGIDTPILDKYLEADLNDNDELLAQGDLWMDLAHACDTAAFDTMEALRNAVKRLYSVPYGMARAKVLHMIAKDYDDYTGHYPDHEPLQPLLSHPLVAELLRTRETLREIIEDEHGLYDATGRFIPLSKWNGEKKKENRWRGLMSYINATYETEIIGAPFEEAIAEKERDARTKFKIVLLQGDGFSIQVSSKASIDAQVKRLKNAVAERAEELGVPTKLTVDWPA